MSAFVQEATATRSVPGLMVWIHLIWFNEILRRSVNMSDSTLEWQWALIAGGEVKLKTGIGVRQ